METIYIPINKCMKKVLCIYIYVYIIYDAALLSLKTGSFALTLIDLEDFIPIGKAKHRRILHDDLISRWKYTNIHTFHTDKK